MAEIVLPEYGPLAASIFTTAVTIDQFVRDCGGVSDGSAMEVAEDIYTMLIKEGFIEVPTC